MPLEMEKLQLGAEQTIGALRLDAAFQTVFLNTKTK